MSDQANLNTREREGEKWNNTYRNSRMMGVSLEVSHNKESIDRIY